MDLLKKHEKEIDKIIDRALKEDIGAGDITTEFVVPRSIPMIFSPPLFAAMKMVVRFF